MIHLTTGAARRSSSRACARAPIPSLFREFSAPVHVQSDLTPEDRLFLIGRDPDPFNRWEAAQQVALAMLERATAAIRARRDAGASIRASPRSLQRLADNDELDPAFRALALQLPSEIDIAQAIGRDIDPDAIHRARRALQAYLGRAIGETVARGRRALGADAGLFARTPTAPAAAPSRMPPGACWSPSGAMDGADLARALSTRPRTSPTGSRRSAFSSITGSTAPTTRSTASTPAIATMRWCSTNGSPCRRRRRATPRSTASRR